MKKKYQVFLSSTYEDLKEERSIVIQTLLEMDFIPCGMELFPAADDDQWSVIKKLIDECDYYIVILAGRYGSIDDTHKKSYTQLEYEYAISKNKPVIAFLHDKVKSLPNDKCEESKEGKKKLEDFRALCKKKLIKPWSNGQQLGNLVSTSLTKLIESRPAIGWVRANEIVKSKTVLSEDFFYTLDENPNSGFTKDIKGAKRVSILARTAVNLLSQYDRQLEALMNEGGIVQFLFISPESEATKYVYGSNPKVFNENIRKMNFHLQALHEKGGGKFIPKCIQHAPTISLIYIEKENPEENFIIVQLYFLHSRISRDRPLFRIYPSDKWYGAFLEEFNQLWKDADKCTIIIEE